MILRHGKWTGIFLLVAGIYLLLPVICLEGGLMMFSKKIKAQEIFALPDFAAKGNMTVEQALKNRHSTRSFTSEALGLEEAGQLLWAAQGINRPQKKYRTAPSAGALFPLEVFLVAGKIDGLEPGVYRYLPPEHGLSRIKTGDLRRDLYNQALRQSSVVNAPAVIVISGIYERTTGRYGDRGRQYVHMEVGHAGQNIHLQAEALNLGTVVIGAFNDSGVQQVLGLEQNEIPMYLMPVGR